MKTLQATEVLVITDKSVKLKFINPITNRYHWHWFPKKVMKLNIKTMEFRIPYWLWDRVKKTL